MSPEVAQTLREELSFAREKECLPVLHRLKNLVNQDSSDPELLRLMATPLLYSVWERVFSLSTSICLRVIQEAYESAGDCPPNARAFWLRKANFFKSFVDSVRDVLELEREDSAFQLNAGFKKRISRGTFSLSIEVLSKLDAWHRQPLEHKGGCQDLVLTYSNVNDAVVTTNADAIGLTSLQSYQSLNLKRLGELVGIRNGIGHGASLVAPGHRELGELIEYTEQLISQYVDVACEWIGLNEGS